MYYPEQKKNPGKNCGDRQRINRKSDRLIQKLSSLPAIECDYILNRIDVHFFPEKYGINTSTLLSRLI